MRRQKTFLTVLLVLMVVGMGNVAAAQDEKIAVAAAAPEANAAVSQMAGRAGYFLFFDNQGKLLEAVANPNTGVVGGAGRNTADLLHQKNTTIFIAGKIGPKMRDALQWYQIEYIEQTGVAHDVVKTYLHNR